MQGSRIAAMVGLAMCAGGAWAQPEVIKGPYLQHMLTDAVTIMWETDRPADSTVFYSAGSQWREVSVGGSRTIHEVRLTEGLGAGDLVRYYIETSDAGGTTQSDQALFDMAPVPGSPFRMCVWGDSQDRPEVFSRHVARMIVDEPDMLLAVGDIVSTGTVYEQWENRFFTPLRDLIKTTPMIVAIGNHEQDASWFYDFLDQPHNEHWFSYTYGNAFFLVLDTNYPFTRGTEQYDYAYDALLSDEAQNATWLFVAHHHPGYSEIYEEGRYAEIRRHLIPLYESAGVDVNFHGHIHDYERGEYIPPETQRPIWQVQTSGGGGTLWWDEFDGEWDQIDLVILDQYHYCIVDVGATELLLRAVNLDGDIIDEFTIPARDRDGGPPDDGGDTNDPVATQWDFGADLAASYGVGEMRFNDGEGGSTDNASVFGTTDTLGLPPIAGEVASVMGFPKAADSAMGFVVEHGGSPNEGGVYVNDYTLVTDILIPASSFSQDAWFAFHNTNCCNGNDADTFVRLSDGGVGISGVYEGNVPADAWRRVALVFDHDAGSTILRKYIDGSLVGSQDLGALDGRWSLYSKFDTTPTFHLFTDDTGDATSGYVSSMFFTDRALSDAEVQALGAADADGVMDEPIDCLADWDGNGSVDSQDFLAFLNDWVAQQGDADLNEDGMVDSRDFLDYLNLWSDGC